MVKCQSKINTMPFFRIAHKWNRIICIFVRNVIRRRRKHFDHSVIIVWAIYLVTKLFYFIFRTSLDAFMRSFNVWSIENKTAINVSSAILLVRTWTSILFFSIFSTLGVWCTCMFEHIECRLNDYYYYKFICFSSQFLRIISIYSCCFKY